MSLKHKTVAEKFYITTTLPYVNSDPHIGFALEIIQADVVARYERMRGREVFFNTGTDEHGLKIYEKAEEEGLAPKKLCDKYSRRFRDLGQVLNLSYTNFIRTTEEHHLKAAQEFWRRCDENGYIYKKEYKAKYCVGCEMRKTDSELEKGRCPLHPDRELRIIEEENYFFKFSKFEKKLLRLYEEVPDFVVPEFRLREISDFVKGGLEDFSISRLKSNLPWGIPVPGDEEQVIYVWLEALVNYISALGWPGEEQRFESFWPGVQVAGKDNLRQQTAIWQALLMAAGLPPSKQIFIHGFVTSGGKKMSKSLGNVVDPFQLVEEYGTDPVRYYFLREFSPFRDGDFTDKRFRERYNADLANGLGNLLSRVLAMADRRSGGEFDYQPDQEFRTLFEKKEEQVEEATEGYLFNRALGSVWEMIGFFDAYIEREKVWEGGSGQALSNLLAGLAETGKMLFPFLPGTAEEIFSRLGTERGGPRRFKVERSEPLFPRL